MATYCKKCGNIITEDEKFCGQCGEKKEERDEKITVSKNTKKWLWIPLVLIIIAVIALMMSVSKKNYQIAKFDVKYNNWREIEIDNSYVENGKKAAIPIREEIIIKDGIGEILYNGNEKKIEIDDTKLGDQEVLEISITAYFDGDKQLTQTKTVNASPKSFTVNRGITYPLDEKNNKGNYDISSFSITRQGNTEEEKMVIGENIALTGKIRAYIGNDESKYVDIPFKSGTEEFLISDNQGAEDFLKILQEKIANDTSVNVSFQIIALYRGAEIVFDTISKKIKSNSERKSEAENYAKIAWDKIVNEYGGGQDKRVEVKEWSFDYENKKYSITMDGYFNGAVFRDNNYQMSGILTVNEEGSQANFSKTYANKLLEDLEFKYGFMGAIGSLMQNAQ